MKSAAALPLLACLALHTAAVAAPVAAPAAGAAPGPAAAGSGTARRFALIASANDGGPGRTRLRYADSDARAVADVLRTLGEVRPQDLVLVPGATRASLERSFNQMRETLQRTGRIRGGRREIIVYYSGHSDEEGLLLGAERVSYPELRGWIEGSGAEVKIAVLDSCASGALLARKGGSRVASFLDDVSTDARGHAFLTASSADEAAQESERIGAAFFTHYLLSGLRGAADTTRDGKVTLNEAYHFAYNETLRRTERTAAGPQHPEYAFNMTGKGDLVLTNLRASGATLVLDDKLAGRVFVRDSEGRLLVELRKEPLYPVELGLGPGDYNVLVDADGRPFEARVSLRDGQRTRLGTKELSPVAPLVASTRGDVVASVPPPGVVGSVSAGVASPGQPRAYRTVPLDFVLVPGVRSSGSAGGPVLNNFVFGIVGHSDALQGVQLSLGGNMVEDRMSGVQLAMGFNLTRGPSKGLQMSTANIATGSYRGAQLSDVINVSLGDFKGLQLAPGNWANSGVRGVQLGVLNRSGDLRGVQLGVVGVARGDVHGPQIGVVNWVDGHMKGPQVGVINYTGGDRNFLQLGVVDVTRGQVTGGQIGVASVAGGMQGVQLAVVNVGGTVKGAQIGVINVANRVEGMQFGVINVGRSVSGASVGLLSLIGDGYHAANLWASDVMPTNLGFKLGSKHVYSLLGGGIGRGDDDKALYGLHVGIGVHLTFGDRLFLDVDAVGTQFASANDWKEEPTFSSLRAVVGWRIMKHLAVTAGPTFNVNVRRKDDSFRREGLGILESTHSSGDHEVRLFPGLVAGLQL